jgi:hypothetical protein
VSYAGKIYFKSIPLYGNPTLSNEMFEQGETLIPVKLPERIFIWEKKAKDQLKMELMETHGSYNRMVKA